MRTVEAIITDDLQGLRLDKALAVLFPDYSRTFLRARIESGQVRVNNRQPQARDKLHGGEHVVVEVDVDDANAAVQATNIPLSVVAEDEHLLVVDKPAGLVTHPAAGHASDTLVNALIYRFPELSKLPRAGIVHRLDKDTSGLLVVARSRLALHSLSTQLKMRQVKRIYSCLVRGEVVAGGTIDAPIARHPRDRKRMAVVVTGRPAVTHYRVVKRFTACTLLSVALATGRTHQIRVHLAHQRYPLIGDPVYGVRWRLRRSQQTDQVVLKCLLAFKRQALHACSLSFKHPSSGKPQCYRSALPEDFSRLLACLGAASPARRSADSSW